MRFIIIFFNSSFSQPLCDITKQSIRKLIFSDAPPIPNLGCQGKEQATVEEHNN